MATVDVIRDLIGGGLVAYNRPVAARFGVNAAVLLHELAFWCNKSEDGWCYRTQVEIQEATAMSAEVQHTARKILKAAGVIEERREGIPARLYYCIHYSDLVIALETAEAQNQESSKPETVVVKAGDSNRETASLTYKASKSNQVDQQVKENNARVNDERFEVFWKRYPRKTNKQMAKRIWDRSKPDESLLSVMLESIAKQSASRQWQNPELIPHASTWLNGERWNDELPAAREAKKTPEEISNEEWAKMAEERGLNPNRAEREGRIQVDDAYETQYRYAE